MVAVAERQQVLGAVLCQQHGATVDLLCTQCLARLSMPAAVPTFAVDAERFLHEHHHAQDVPEHHWSDDGSPSVHAHIGVVCDGSRRQIESARMVIDLARAAGHHVHVIHPESAHWAPVPGDVATTLEAGEFAKRRRDAVLALATESPGTDVVVREESSLEAAVELASSSETSLLVILHPRIASGLVKRLITRRVRRCGVTPPRVFVVRSGRGSRSALADTLAGGH
jgi:hypothetical protein